MAKYKRLLVAVDGSETGLHALRESFKLTNSWVTVVAVAPFYEGDLRMVGLAHPQVHIMEPCSTALESAQQMADEAGAVIQTVCAVGPPHERIVEVAAAGNRDLIVMGDKGLSFIERALVGSVTRRVIGYTEKDVLVVPLHAQVGWDKILLATDASPSSLRAKEKALDLAQDYGSELLVVAVMEFSPQLYGQGAVVGELRGRLQEHVDEIVAQAQSRNIAVTGQVLGGTPYKAITGQAAQEKINLIVIGSHGHTGLRRLLMGSVTEKVIGHTPCPVLVVQG